MTRPYIVWNTELTIPIRDFGSRYAWTGLAWGNWSIGILRRLPSRVMM